jgi:multiple antibiotic resistance protein
MATSVEKVVNHIPVAIGIVIVSFLSWLVLRSSTKVVDLLGSTGVNVLTRLMGLILVCIGIQFIADGFFDLVTDKQIVAKIIAVYSA